MNKYIVSINLILNSKLELRKNNVKVLSFLLKNHTFDLKKYIIYTFNKIVNQRI